jgi:hypothetical protein
VLLGIMLAACDVARGWNRYGLVDVDDLAAYVYRALTLGSGFENHSSIQEALQAARRSPGHFAKVSKALTSRELAKKTNSKEASS